jgi:hypothetical protein
MKRKFIFIDDDPICNMISRQIIRNEFPEADMSIFESARLALAHLVEMNEGEKGMKTWIFLDLNMPEMNGFEFLEEFSKRMDSLTDIEVKVLTSSIDDRDRIRVSNYAFVSGFHSKPFDPSYT